MASTTTKLATKSTTSFSTPFVTAIHPFPRNSTAFRQNCLSLNPHTRITDQRTYTNAVTQNRPSPPPTLPSLSPSLSFLPAFPNPASKTSTKTHHTTPPSLCLHTASPNPTSLALAMPRLPTEIPAGRDAALSRRWAPFLRWSDDSEEERKWE